MNANSMPCNFHDHEDRTETTALKRMITTAITMTVYHHSSQTKPAVTQENYSPSHLKPAGIYIIQF
jgi:hypothetical protein